MKLTESLSHLNLSYPNAPISPHNFTDMRCPKVTFGNLHAWKFEHQQQLPHNWVIYESKISWPVEHVKEDENWFADIEYV